jgi:hypothetical protein
MNLAEYDSSVIYGRVLEALVEDDQLDERALGKMPTDVVELFGQLEGDDVKLYYQAAKKGYDSLSDHDQKRLRGALEKAAKGMELDHADASRLVDHACKALERRIASKASHYVGEDGSLSASLGAALGEVHYAGDTVVPGKNHGSFSTFRVRPRAGGEDEGTAFKAKTADGKIVPIIMRGQSGKGGEAEVVIPGPGGKRVRIPIDKAITLRSAISQYDLKEVPKLVQAVMRGNLAGVFSFPEHTELTERGSVEALDSAANGIVDDLDQKTAKKIETLKKSMSSGADVAHVAMSLLSDLEGERKRLKGSLSAGQDKKLRKLKALKQVVSELLHFEHAELGEVAPPGFEGTVLAMKKKHPEIKNPWAMAWVMKNKGQSSHYKIKGGKAVPKKEDAEADECTGDEDCGCGCKEVDEASKETFVVARTRILDHLGKEGWKVTAHLKIPKAQKEDTTLWFKPQAVYMGQRNDFGNARSIHIDDIRGMSTDDFMAHVKRWITIHDENKSTYHREDHDLDDFLDDAAGMSGDVGAERETDMPKTGSPISAPNDRVATTAGGGLSAALMAACIDKGMAATGPGVDEIGVLDADRGEFDAGNFDDQDVSVIDDYQASMGEAVKAGQLFIIVDKKTGQAIGKDIFQGTVKADGALAKMGGEKATGYQVMDAMWHNPTRAKLKAMGWIGEASAYVRGGKARRVVIRGDKFKIAKIMADAHIPFIFVREAGTNTVGDVPTQHLSKLSKLLKDKPELEGRFAKIETEDRDAPGGVQTQAEPTVAGYEPPYALPPNKLTGEDAVQFDKVVGAIMADVIRDNDTAKMKTVPPQGVAKVIDPTKYTAEEKYEVGPAFKKFMEVYAEELAKAVEKYPSEYGFPVSEVPVVVGRMKAAMERGSFNHAGHAFKATAKRLGIKPTRQAIVAYISGSNESIDDIDADTRIKLAETYDRMVSGKDLSKEELVDAERYKQLVIAKMTPQGVSTEVATTKRQKLPESADPEMNETIQIRASAYHDREGFTISGSPSDGGGRIKIFVRLRETAEKIRALYKKQPDRPSREDIKARNDQVDDLIRGEAKAESIDEAFEDAAIGALREDYMGHHFFDGKSWYADTAFINDSQRVMPGMELKHMGFGEFQLVGKAGKIDFDRMRGKDFPGQHGRSHKLYDDQDGKLVKELIAAMEKHHKSELVKEDADLDEGSDPLGKPEIVHGMKFGGTRYKFLRGVNIDHVESKGDFVAWQADSPKSKQLGTAKSLDAAKQLAVKHADLKKRLGESEELTEAPRGVPRPGTRVKFTPNPASYMLYTKPPKKGEEGEVTTIPLGGSRSHYMPGPGGGLVYVKWDEHGTMGISPHDVEKIRGGGASTGKLKGKKLSDEIARLFKQHSNGVQFNIMDLGKLHKDVEAANDAGENLEAAMVAAVRKYAVGGHPARGAAESLSGAIRASSAVV